MSLSARCKCVSQEISCTAVLLQQMLWSFDTSVPSHANLRMSVFSWSELLEPEARRRLYLWRDCSSGPRSVDSSYSHSLVQHGPTWSKTSAATEAAALRISQEALEITGIEWHTAISRYLTISHDISRYLTISHAECEMRRIDGYLMRIGSNRY